MNTVIATIDTNANPAARREIAQLYMDVEDYPAAAAMLKRHLASEEGRKDTLAWRMLGDCTLSSGDPVNAKRAYRRALGLAVNYQPEGAKAAATP
jgi:Tfp pilus assembly protein PilF